MTINRTEPGGSLINSGRADLYPQENNYHEKSVDFLTVEQLARYFYKYPLNGFPILDSSYKFSGLLLRRYVLNNMSEFKAAKTPVQYIIEKHVYYPSEGEILRMIFGEKRIQEFPVLNRKGFLMGIWELSSFFRIFDKLPFSAYLNFHKIFDLFPRPVYVTDDQNKLMSFNREMVRFAAIEQDDSRQIGRKINAIMRDLGWKMTAGENDQWLELHNGKRIYRVETFQVDMENNRQLSVYIVQQGKSHDVMQKSLQLPVEQSLNKAVESLEKMMISDALGGCDGSISRASLKLGIPRQTLLIKARIYNLIKAD